MIPLQVGVLVAGILGCLLMNVSIRSLSNNWNSSYYGATQVPFETVFNSLTSMLSALIFSLVFASVIVTMFLIAHHLYRSFIGNEGYLAFTLPVKTSHHLISKTLTGFTWLVINCIVLICVFILMTLIGFSYEGLINYDVLEIYGELLQMIFTGKGIITTLEVIVLGLISLAASVLTIYASIILGGAIAKTHKVMAAVGMYLAITTITQIIYSILIALISFITYETSYSSSYYPYSLSYPDWFLTLQPFMLSMIICSAVIGVVLYFISKSSLKNNLNLD